MLFVATFKWSAENVPKIIETRLKNPLPPEVKVLGEAVLFGQHTIIGLYEAPDETTFYKTLTPYLQISTIKARNAITVEEAIKIATGQ